MAAGPWVFTNAYRNKLASRYINGGSALTFKCALLLSTSNISTSSTTYAALTNEHANANGYTTGGVSVAFTLAGTPPNAKVQFTANPSWAASGGSIVFRWAVIYEVGADVVCFCLGDSTPANVTIANGSGVLIDSDGTPEPVFELA